MADNTNFHFTAEQSSESSDSDSVSDSAKDTSENNVSWVAPEFIDHERSAGWYLLLITGTAVVAALIYWVTRDFFALGATIAAGVILAVFAGHKPREMTYIVTKSGLKVGEKNYNYSLFKSFSVIREGQQGSIVLSPLKRIMPPVTAYFSPQDETKVVQAIGEHLPYEDKKLDIADKLIRRLKF